MFQQVKALFTILRKQKHIYYGIPFFGFVAAGWFMVKQTQAVKFEFSSKVTPVSKQEVESLGLHLKKPSSLEDIYEDFKKIDIDNWENKRGPRPWGE